MIFLPHTEQLYNLHTQLCFIIFDLSNFLFLVGFSMWFTVTQITVTVHFYGRIHKWISCKWLFCWQVSLIFCFINDPKYIIHTVSESTVLKAEDPERGKNRLIEKADILYSCSLVRRYMPNSAEWVELHRLKRKSSDLVWVALETESRTIYLCASSLFRMWSKEAWKGKVGRERN